MKRGFRATTGRPSGTVHLYFQVMVGCGLLLAFTALVAAFLWWRSSRRSTGNGETDEVFGAVDSIASDFDPSLPAFAATIRGPAAGQSTTTFNTYFGILRADEPTPLFLFTTSPQRNDLVVNSIRNFTFTATHEARHQWVDDLLERTGPPYADDDLGILGRPDANDDLDCLADAAYLLDEQTNLGLPTGSAGSILDNGNLEFTFKGESPFGASADDCSFTPLTTPMTNGLKAIERDADRFALTMEVL